jgi:hypothetical protein
MGLIWWRELSQIREALTLFDARHADCMAVGTQQRATAHPHAAQGVSMENMFATLGSIGGIVVAVLILALAWWVVMRARSGNRKVREARRDPHTDRAKLNDPKDPRRDIPR